LATSDWTKGFWVIFSILPAWESMVEISDGPAMVFPLTYPIGLAVYQLKLAFANNSAEYLDVFVFQGGYCR